MTRSARDPLELRQLHGVETPEHVEVRFELAGVGSRTAAAFLDFFLVSLGMMALSIIYGSLQEPGGPSTVARGWAIAAVGIVASFLLWAYFTLFEGLNGGRTPGKQALGLRVVMDTGRRITFSAAAVRNLVRLLDCFFPFAPVLPGLLVMFLHKSNKRLGDIAAGTVVVRDRPTEWSLGAAAVTEEPLEAGPPELTEEEFRLLDRFLGRLDELDPMVQRRLTAELARRFETRVPRRTADLLAYLHELHAEEQRKRRGRFATRAQPGAAGRTTVTAERFVERKRETWEAFYTLAKRMEGSGVGALAPDEIPGFAARYREVAADLARARTYGVDSRVVEYLERVVSAGHNALYRARGRERTPVLRYIARDFPAAVVQSRAYVAAAFLCFVIPACVGYAMIRERPALADEIVSPVMVSRAEQAAERQRRGQGYAEEGPETRPALAAAIISNNVQISFGTFVGGLTAGVLTMWLLVINGLLLGIAFGLFVNYGAGMYLATFVAGHGVLELTAIFIAAGAGFRVAHAIIAPGDRTRRDALVVEGRVAVRMVGAVVVLLAIAGAIEGLFSASRAPAVAHFAVSGATVVFLLVYFASGWAYSRVAAAKGRRL